MELIFYLHRVEHCSQPRPGPRSWCCVATPAVLSHKEPAPIICSFRAWKPPIPCAIKDQRGASKILFSSIQLSTNESTILTIPTNDSAPLWLYPEAGGQQGDFYDFQTIDQSLIFVISSMYFTCKWTNIKHWARLTGFYSINDNKVAVALVLKFCSDHSRCNTMQQQV